MQRGQADVVTAGAIRAPPFRLLNENVFRVPGMYVQMRVKAAHPELGDLLVGKPANPMFFGDVDLLDHPRDRRNKACYRAR